MERKGKRAKMSRLIKVRFTAIDAAIVKRKADASGLSTSEFVRRTLFGRVIKLKDPNEPIRQKNHQLLAEVKAHLLKLNIFLQEKKEDPLLMKDNEKILKKIENL